LVLQKNSKSFYDIKQSLAEQGLDDGFDDSLIQDILRLVLRKRSKALTVAAIVEKKYLRNILPGLVVPNTKLNVSDELEGLMPKWKKEQDTKQSKRRRSRRPSDGRSERNTSSSNTKQRSKRFKDEHVNAVDDVVNRGQKVILFEDGSDHEDPAFLCGYGKHIADLEPVKVVKNLDGSLAQAALV